jgi:hypothetical protein
MLRPQDVGAYEISSFIELYEKAWGTLDRLISSTTEITSESE